MVSVVSGCEKVDIFLYLKGEVNTIFLFSYPQELKKRRKMTFKFLKSFFQSRDILILRFSKCKFDDVIASKETC